MSKTKDTKVEALKAQVSSLTARLEEEKDLAAAVADRCVLLQADLEAAQENKGKWADWVEDLEAKLRLCSLYFDTVYQLAAEDSPIKQLAGSYADTVDNWGFGGYV